MKLFVVNFQTSNQRCMSVAWNWNNMVSWGLAFSAMLRSSAAIHLPSSYQVFTRLVCCFKNEIFINLLLLWSDYCERSSVFVLKEIFSSTHCWLVLIDLTTFFTVLPSRNYKSIISRSHGFRFVFSSNHMT